MKINEILNQMKPVSLDLDRSLITDDIKQAVPHLKSAMDRLNQIYLKQQDEQLPELLERIMREGDNDLKDFVQTSNGPWNTLDGFKSVTDQMPDRAPGCSFFPKGMSKEELSSKIEQLPKKDQEPLLDYYTVVRSGAKGTLEAIPYHEYYGQDLKFIADELRKGASKVKHQGLKDYLVQRAKTLEIGDYRSADSTWVRLKDAPLEVVIGPYEVYDDGLLGIKASYEAMLMVVDKKRGQALCEIENNVKELAVLFPMPGGSKPAMGGLAPITVVHEIYASGEARAGVMASAFNLPNDPWVRKNVGWKQVMIYNVMQAKFNNCTKAISKKLVAEGEKVDFEPYFFFVLLHEVSHGLGPAYRKNGEAVSKSLGSCYTAIEEAKADMGAFYLLQKCGGKFGVPAFEKEVLLRSYLAGLMRSMRFGLHEAHGAANIVQFNWFEEKGIIKDAPGGKFSTSGQGLEKATIDLLDKLCELEATATPDEAKAFLDRYAKPSKKIENAISSLADIPIDIRAKWPSV